MGKRQELAKKGAIVRYLIDENKYIEALEIIEEMDLEEVESTADLNLFADLYEKAERFDKKKDIYYIIYKRNHSRHVLNRLLRLAIQMGEMEEARELFLTYEMAGSVTLETYELRYLLARAEGASRKVLIDILEELKKEEYTEKWGYQLARLYEQEGMRDECIRECKELIMWFGTGAIIEKAKELLAQCEEPDWQPPQEEEIPEPVKNDAPEILPYAAGPVKVKELSEVEDDDEEEEEEEMLIEDESVAGEVSGKSEDEAEAPEENPEEEDEEVSEENPEGEKEEVSEENLGEEDEEEPEEVLEDEVPEKPAKKSAFQRFREFFRAEDVFAEDEPEETPGLIIDDSVKDFPLDMEEEETGEADSVMPAHEEEEAASVDEIDKEDEIAASIEASLEVKVSEHEENIEIEEPNIEESNIEEPDVVEPKEVESGMRAEVEAPPQKPQKIQEPQEIKEPQEIQESQELQEPQEPEDISEKGIAYRTLKGTMNYLNHHEGMAHFVFAGGEERITLTLAKRMTKELNKIGYLSAGSINRISADMLNQIELMDQTDKLLGGCTLITSAPELYQKSVNDLITCMKKYKEQMVIMISGPFDEMDCFLASYPELAELFDFKVKM